MSRLFSCMFCLLLLASSQQTFAEVSAGDGFVRALLPGKHMTAAFITLNNSDKEMTSLLSVTLEGADKVELHNHTHENGVMRMRQVEKIDIAGQGSVTLAPGGLHMMIFGVDKLAEQAKLELCFSNKQCLKLVLPVKQQ